jgi:hypothetical protein
MENILAIISFVIFTSFSHHFRFINFFEFSALFIKSFLLPFVYKILAIYF